MNHLRVNTLVHLAAIILVATLTGCTWASAPKASPQTADVHPSAGLETNSPQPVSPESRGDTPTDSQAQSPPENRASNETATVTNSDNAAEKVKGNGRGRSRGQSSTPDATPPTIVIGSPTPSDTSSGPVTYLVSYNEADSITLRKRDVTLNTTGSALGSITVSQSGAKSRTIEISNITGNGTLGITIAPGTAVDAAGNLAAGAGPSATAEVVNPAPTLTIGEPSDTVTNTGPISFTISYANADTISLSEQDITLSSQEGVTGSVNVAGSGTAERTVTLDNLTGTGTFTISVAAGTAENVDGETASSVGPSSPVDVYGPQPTLEPGPGFDGPTPQPDAIGTGPGSDAKAIARWDVVPYQTFDGIFQIGVVAFHINGIDRVEFSLEGGPWTAAMPVMTRNPLTDVIEYWVNLDARLLPDGPIEIRAIAYPTVGIPRVLQGDTITFGDGEYSMCLYSNGSQSFAPARVYVSLSGSDSNPGTEQQPLATIGRGFQLAGDGGEVLLKDAGVYMAPEMQSIRIFNTRWIMVRAADGMTADDVTISAPTWTYVRPEVARVLWQNVSFDLSSISQYYAYSGLPTEYYIWFDRCRFFDPLGWTNHPERTAMIRGSYYATESTVHDTLYGFASAILVRGCRLERISGDALQNSNTVLDTTADSVGGSELDHHTDLYQMWGEMDNIIVYGMRAWNLFVAQSIFLQPTIMSAPDERNFLRNSAFVDLDIENIPVFQNGVNMGGPPFSQMQSGFDHILFHDVKLTQQRMMLRTDYVLGVHPQGFEAKNVLFDQVVFHPATWRTYCDPTATEYESVDGVQFVSCTPADLDP